MFEKLDLALSIMLQVYQVTSVKFEVHTQCIDITGFSADIQVVAV